ncbi:4-hydroxy-3-methylbut-2-enyl diphosphate reductase [bacterium]|nr:4-hydroxy-3-methylbut-2-enyl diphosphate reductase [bacterium]
MTGEYGGIQKVQIKDGRFNVWCVKDAGFCFGVERAVKMAKDAAARFGRVYSLGPLIHNKDVVESLEREGICVAESLEQVGQNAVIARSHGLPPEIAQAAHKRRIEIIDGTCPFVKKAQDYAKLLRNEGYHIVIVGNASHPEVKGLLGFSGRDAQVVNADTELELTGNPARVGIIAQTTERIEVFARIVSNVVSQAKEVRVFNTVCDSAISRRENTRRLANFCDVVIVIGGKHSANTNQLTAVSRQCGTQTYHIERPEQLMPEWFKGKHSVGVTVGASTPEWITSAVIDRLRESSQSPVSE